MKTVLEVFSANNPEELFILIQKKQLSEDWNVTNVVVCNFSTSDKHRDKIEIWTALVSCEKKESKPKKKKVKK